MRISLAITLRSIQRVAEEGSRSLKLSTHVTVFLAIMTHTKIGWFTFW